MAVRGRLRVLLGAAPGVGKTYAMLDEGKHLRAGGGLMSLSPLLRLTAGQLLRQ